jgi:hypothetical protein
MLFGFSCSSRSHRKALAPKGAAPIAREKAKIADPILSLHRHDPGAQLLKSIAE